MTRRYRIVARCFGGRDRYGVRERWLGFLWLPMVIGYPFTSVAEAETFIADSLDVTRVVKETTGT